MSVISCETILFCYFVPVRQKIALRNSVLPKAILRCILLEKHQTNSGHKHKDKTHFTLDLTFRMLQHTSSEVTVEQIQI